MVIRTRDSGEWGVDVIRVRESGEWIPRTVRVRENGEWVAHTQFVIDDFEHDDLPLYYTIPSSSGDWFVTSRAARQGNFGLEIDGFYDPIWSAPGDGLKYYPEDGRTFEMFVNPRSYESNTQLWWYFGGSNPNNCYRIEWLGGSSSGNFRVRRRVNGSNTTVAWNDGSTTYFQSGWHRILIDWFDGGGFRARLFRPFGSEPEEDIATSDSTYTGEGIIGYRNGGGATTWHDDIQLLPQ